MSEELRSPRHHVLRQMLRERRIRAGLTQDQLAEKLGVSQATVSAIERGDQRVSVVQYLDFADVLGFDARSGLRRVHGAKRR
jgi:transcriptional regulator with XRE-family HTH domain